MICFGCERYGHKQEACPQVICSGKQPKTGSELPPASAMTVATHTAESEPIRVDNVGNTVSADSVAKLLEDSSESCFGPWMIAKKQVRRRAPVTKSHIDHAKKPNVQPSGSRFDALNDASHLEARVAKDVPSTPALKNANPAAAHNSGPAHKHSQHKTAQKKGTKNHASTKPVGKDKGKSIIKEPSILGSKNETANPPLLLK